VKSTAQAAFAFGAGTTDADSAVLVVSASTIGRAT